MNGSTLLVQGAIFNAIALGYVVLFIYWIYLSPLPSSRAAAQSVPARLKRRLAVAVMVAD